MIANVIHFGEYQKKKLWDCLLVDVIEGKSCHGKGNKSKTFKFPLQGFKSLDIDIMFKLCFSIEDLQIYLLVI